jgi:hypothetical protein
MKHNLENYISDVFSGPGCFLFQTAVQALSFFFIGGHVQDSHSIAKRIFHLALGLVLVGGFAAAGSFAVGQTTSMSRATGEACDDYPEGESCASGIAIDITFGFVCTNYCEDETDCPAEWGCKQVPEGAGTYASLCFPRRVTISQ